MAKKVPVDRLREAVDKSLAEYGDTVKESAFDVTKAMAKEGVKTLRAESKNTFNGTGDYAKGWTSQYEEGRLSAQGIIYNKDLPGLPHLLEHGHAKRGGGRVEGKAHIAPVEEALVKEFEEKVKSKL